MKTRNRTDMWHRVVRSVVRATSVQFALFVLACVAADGKDWPTYHHDNARSAVTPEQLELPLSEHWRFASRHVPDPAWPRSGWPQQGVKHELPRLNFDDAFHIAVGGDALYFGSSADNKVYCLDTATGAIRWTFFTDGPVRLAPTVWKDKVFVGSDDGFVYCLGAASGKVVWKFRAAPGDRKVLGNGKMISLWPVRTGVLVDHGVAYFGAGVFPNEGICVYAIRAEDGKLVWKNDTCGRRGWLSPQGYLLASVDKLFVPSGRAAPAAFDRKNGRLLYQSRVDWRRYGKAGGTYALIAGDHIFTGAEQVFALDQKKGRPGFAWFRGRRLIITQSVSYLLTNKEVIALDRKAYPAASRNRHNLLKEKWCKLDYRRYGLRMKQRPSLAMKVEEAREKLEQADGTLKELREAGREQTTKFAELATQRQELSKDLESLTKKLEAMDKELAEIQERFKRRPEIEKKDKQKAEDAIRRTIKWWAPCECPYSMILSGLPEEGQAVLFTGGQDKVVAFDANTGKKLWTGSVQGKARGLALSGGRLFVSTDRGSIHCFGKPKPGGSVSVTLPTNPAPYPRDQLTPLYETVAENIIRTTGVTKGYCIVLGAGTGRLAFELAKRTDLTIYGIEADPKKVKLARKMLDLAGLYGARVAIAQGSPARPPYSDYCANLIVSDTVLTGGSIPIDGKRLFEMLKPWGGTAYIGQPPATQTLGPDMLHKWLNESNLPNGQVITKGGCWVKITRGPLQGAGSWTHQYAEPGNTTSSGDELVKYPFRVLWFGEPSRRHKYYSSAPLATAGRFFIQDGDTIQAFDAYNGLRLWTRKIAGLSIRAKPDCGNMAATQDSLFVAAGNKCLRLDAATGEMKATYMVPKAPDGRSRPWGYLGCADGLLFGSSTKRGCTFDRMFAYELESGNLRWTYEVENVDRITVSIGGGRVFFADSGITNQQRENTLRQRREQLKNLKGTEAKLAKKKLKTADVRLCVALDAATGKKCWAKCLDLTDCGGGRLASIYRNEILLFLGSHPNGHFWHFFRVGVPEYCDRRITALSAANGSVLWSRATGYRLRPLVVGETIYAEPCAFDLQTGKQKMRLDAKTGKQVPWEFGPVGGCGFPSACPACLFFRAGTISYYDILRDRGTFHFYGMRPSCWINIIPANGLVLIPDASGGCVCQYPIACTVVLQPKPTERE